MCNFKDSTRNKSFSTQRLTLSRTITNRKLNYLFIEAKSYFSEKLCISNGISAANSEIFLFAKHIFLYNSNRFSL